LREGENVKKWEQEGCIYRVLIGGNKFWNLLKKKFQRVRVTGSAGTGIDLMWTRGEIFEIWISRVGGYGYAGAGTGTGGGYTGAGTRAAGKRVRVQKVFSKKNWPALSNPYPCTRLSAYTRARVRIPRVPGTGTGCTRRVLANP
jgi:hypothetical protein